MDKNHDAKVAGAASPLIFKDPDDGTTITLWAEQLSDKDNIELDAWVRAYYLYVQRSNIPEDATEEDKDRIERIAQHTASTLNWYSGHGISIMASIEGMTQIAYMSIRKRSPKITVEKLRSLLMDERNLDEANKIFEELNLTDNSEDNTSDPTTRGNQIKKTIKKRQPTQTAKLMEKKRKNLRSK